LLGVDIDERKLLLMDAFHSIDGSVIEDARAATCLGQGLQMSARIVEGAVASRMAQTRDFGEARS
jgi:hypothetical protein